MTTRTAAPAESWHVCSTEHRVRVTRRVINRRRRFIASVFKGEQKTFGQTLMGDFASPVEAVKAAQLFIQAKEDDDGQRVCNWRDVERVRAELKREAAK
jgi:hypothetical protein